MSHNTQRHRLGRRLALAVTAAAMMAPMLSVPASAITVSDPAPNGGLAAAGPVDPATGAPAWYEDKNGVRLELCLNDPMCLAILEIPNPAAPLEIPGNFPGEAFWWAGEAEVTSGTASGSIVMASEYAFANEVPAAGEQTVFNRLRIRVDGLTPNETYTITHPYGVEELVADAAGTINFTEDVGCFDIPCAGAAFDRALTGRVGPFLTWDAGAPEGYVGNPNVPHVVTGSPYDTNFFRVEGPEVNMETNLFMVQGKLAPPASAFPDVASDNPFLAEINWLQTNGISTGFPDGSFRPTAPVARDAMAAFIYRLSGSPVFADPAVSPFGDVALDNQFYTEIAWLAAQQITEGFADGGFHPLESVNRDAMAAFLYRLAGEPAFTAPAVSPFPDVATDNPFYTEIAWLAEQGITTGWPDGTFRPTSPVNRDAMAAFMFRWNTLFGTIPATPAAPADPAAPAPANPADPAAPADPADGAADPADGAADGA